MSVNRSGYYKWVARKDEPNRYEQDRILLTKLLKEEHEKHKTKGYHNLAKAIKMQTGWVFSDNLAHKCCKVEGIRSKARRYRYRKAGDEHVSFKNTVNGNWNATKPMELVVSDMTCIFHKGTLYEWTYILDTFNNEIIANSLSGKSGDNRPYYHCLDVLKAKTEKQTHPVVLHTDQGAVYSSRAFQEAHKNYNIYRSMSRVGTPTDNPIIESLNGWMKEEMIIDFGLKESNDISEVIKQYVYYFNNERTAFALDYKTPVQFRTEQGFA